MDKEKFVPESQINKEKFGKNVKIRNFWIRHAQKASGEVFSSDKKALSASSISEKGHEMSLDLGNEIKAARHGSKSYGSSVDRTRETVESILEAYQKNNPDKPTREFRIRDELNAWGPKEYIELYNEKFQKNKHDILMEKGLNPEDFSKQSPDDQQEIAERAEEPVIREWLDDPNSELARLFQPREAAAKFARLFNRRHDRLAHKLNSGSDVDILHSTHKTATEPFLTSGVLIRRSDGERITKLDQLGGSLEPLGNWESDVVTDESGNAQITVQMRGQEYDIDKEVLQSLLEE